MELTDKLRTEDRAVGGTQFFLVITNAPAGTALIGKRLVEAGQLTAAGVYELEVNLIGLAQIECHLMPSQFAGTNFAPSLVSYYANRAKPKTTVAGANFVTAALQSLALSGLKGEKVARVTFTLPGATTITFDPGAGAQGATPAAQAECNGS